jgi:hypothetical protein
MFGWFRSKVSYIMKTLIFAGWLTGALAGLDKLTGHTYASTDLSSILNIGNNLAMASIADIDPFIYLQQHYTYEQVIPDLIGNITGADALDKNTFGVIHDTGVVSLYKDGATAPYFNFLTGGSTGLSWVDPTKYPGEIAVTGTDSILFYTRDGNFKGEMAVLSTL